MGRLPGREALEAELDTAGPDTPGPDTVAPDTAGRPADPPAPEVKAKPEPQIVAWDRRVAPDMVTPPTFRERLRALFAGR